jgi:predicted small secreted protein
MFKFRKQFVYLLLLVGTLMLLSGCATFKGVGDDLDTLGKGIHGS